MILWKCYTQYASKFGKLISGHGTGKVQFSFQSQRKAILKNVQTTTHLYSCHMLARSWSKSSKWGFNSTRTENFQMYKLDLEKSEEPEIKSSTLIHSSKKQKSSSFVLLITPKPLAVWIKTNCGKFLKRWEYQTTLPASWETGMQVKKQ